MNLDTSSTNSLVKKQTELVEEGEEVEDDFKVKKIEGSNQNEEVELPGVFARQYWKLYSMCFIVYFCATMQGYDGSLMGSIYTMDAYLDYYGLDVNSSTSTGLVFSIYNIGQICGAFFVWLMDWKGRKFAILIGCYGVVAGVFITAATSSKEALIGGRWLLSFAATIACAAAPSYCVEVTPAHMRGKIAGLYNTLWYAGSLVAAFSSYGAEIHYPDGNLSFKLPLWLQLMFPSVVCIFGWFLPESPRWLVGVGREDEARNFIAKYHCNGDKHHPFIDAEIAEMVESFNGINLSDPLKIFDLRPLIKTKSSRYRTGLVVAMAWFGQFSGNNVCSYYLPTMLSNVGMTSTSTNVLMNGIYSIVSWFASICGSFAHDKVGRRKMFMISTLGCALALTGLSICTARFKVTGSDSASKGTLVFIYLFGVIFSFAFTPMQPIYPSEVSSNILRSKSQLVLNVTAGVAQFINQFAAPEAMENISYWFYVFYVFFDIFEFAIVYFFFVETKDISLEELDAIFEAPNPRKASTNKEFLESIRLNIGYDVNIHELHDNTAKFEDHQIENKV